MTDKKILNDAINSLENLTELLIGCEIPEGNIYLEAIDTFIKHSIALHAGNEWQPIDTAPKDGTEIIAYRPLAHESNDPYICICKTTPYESTSKQGFKHFTDRYCHPTHWIPLPQPPEQEGE